MRYTCRPIIVSGLTLLGSVALHGQAGVAPVPFHPADAGESSVELVSDGLAARGLAADARCDDSRRRASLVELAWEALPPGTSAMRLDLAKLRDGFATGRFETTGRLAPTLAAVTVDSPEPGVHYYWRLLTETRRGWSASPVARFEAPVCPWDPPRELERLIGESATEGGAR